MDVYLCMTRFILLIAVLFIIGPVTGQSTLEKDLKVVDYKEFEPYLNSSDSKVKVVNFWATWCRPCIKELPYFDALTKTHGEEVEVILVSLDLKKHIDSKLIPFLEKNPLQSEVVVLVDPHENEWIPKVDEKWSGSLPATLIIAGDQRIFFEGSLEEEQLLAELQPYLKP